MYRKDRLFDLISILRDGAVHRAVDLASILDVTPRTIYRDMETLVASGVPVRGTPGAGYQITDSLSLPPLMLSPEELEALNLGLAIVAQAADEGLRQAADTLATKVDAALPSTTIAKAESWGAGAAPFGDAARNLTHRPLLQAAVKARQKVRLTYTGGDRTVTTRVIRPLHMEFWGRVWTLTGWCELRHDFRVFRLDLIETVEAMPELFVDEPGKRLADYAARPQSPPQAP